MFIPILPTKLYIPPSRPKVVARLHLIKRLNDGLHRKLTLISAPAGFGKTTLVSEWMRGCGRPVAWLSLDENDHDRARFLTYFTAALQTIMPTIGARVLPVLQTPQPPPTETVLTILLNEMVTIREPFVLVLDDYHVVDSGAVDEALLFLLDHLPPQMHLVIATREDPPLPLARLRARDQLTELRVADLRFTAAEAADFLNQVMGLQLSPEAVDALETRTEGWIAGLQLAAISMQGHQDTTHFVTSFTGSHHFVMDYLMEEVLQQQPENVQRFLLYTSILDRLCGSLCDAVLIDSSGQETLAAIEQANLFIFPLDHERRWYRYHHLFADLLRQRLRHSLSENDINALHLRASQWFEDHDLELEAFHHAAAGHDLERAERLIDGRGIPLHFRGAVMAILDWLGSLPKSVMDARPSLWWRYASLALVNGQTTGVEERLDAAEAAFQASGDDTLIRRFIGPIAAARATLALTRYQADVMIEQSQRALEYLSPSSLTLRANAYWTLGIAYFYRGARADARRAFEESISLSQRAGDIFTGILATVGLGNVQEAENHLHQAAAIYRQILQMAGDQPLQIVYEAHLGLGRILYEWNDLEAAEQHGKQSLMLARQYDRVIDRFILCEVFLARVKLAQGDVSGAATILAQADQSARQQNFVHRLPEIAAVQVLVLLRQGKLTAAAHLARTHDLSLARVHLAEGDAAAALRVLERRQAYVEAKDWKDERLRVIVLQAVAHYRQGDKGKAIHLISEALAEPGGFIRIFVDEGAVMAQLLAEVRGMMPETVGNLLAVFEAEKQMNEVVAQEGFIEPLSQRELEVLRLIAQGLSNQDISERLYVALSTVKGHNQRIFDKLHVQRRTEAIARARELGLL